MIPALTLLSGVVQLAPALAKVFGASRNASEVAEIAASVAKSVTGLPDNQGALEALRASPQLLIEYQRVLLEQETSFEKLYIDDKKDARLRDVEFLKAGTRNYRSDFLVGNTVLVVFTILAIVTFVPNINEYAKGALTTILGVFLNQLNNVYSFEFGSTRKSEDKDKLAAQKEI